MMKTKFAVSVMMVVFFGTTAFAGPAWDALMGTKSGTNPAPELEAKAEAPAAADETVVEKKDDLEAMKKSLGISDKKTTKAEKKDAAFDVEDPSTWRGFTTSVKNVRGYDNGLVGTMTKTVKVRLPKDTIILAINTPSKTIKGEGSIEMKAGEDFTVWFAQAVKPGKRPQIQREADAKVVNLADVATSARAFAVVELQGENGVIVTVDDTPVRIPAGQLPENVSKLLVSGATYLGRRSVNGEERVPDAIEDDIVLFRGNSFSVYYKTGKETVNKDVNGQAAASLTTVVVKKLSDLKQYGELKYVPGKGGKPNTKGVVFTAHQPMRVQISSEAKWLKKGDLDGATHNPASFQKGGTFELSQSEECTLWGNSALKF